MVREKKVNLWVIITVLVLLLVVGGGAIIYYYSSGPVTTPEGQGSYCTAESRNADFCLEVYKPVCGWNNATKIQCIKYPCAQTYSNNCFACQNENVEYYTEGECPK